MFVWYAKMEQKCLQDARYLGVQVLGIRTVGSSHIKGIMASEGQSPPRVGGPDWTTTGGVRDPIHMRILSLRYVCSPVATALATPS